MKCKSEVYGLFAQFKVLVENLFDCKIEMFKSDGAREFDKSLTITLLNQHGIYFRKSCPDTQ